MLDINYIIKNHKVVKKAAKDKGVDIDVSELIKIDKKRRELLQSLESLNQKRNEHAAAQKGSAGKPVDSVIAEGKKIKEEIAHVEPELRSIEEAFKELMLLVPNVPSKDTPIGPDESCNKEVRTWGKKPSFDFKIKDHITLGEELDIIDTERGVKVSGFRGYYLKNEAAQLQWALLSYCIAKMRNKSFKFFIAPTMVREMALVGSGHFPSLREETYPVDDKFLVGTSEPSLLAYRADEILNPKEFPLKYFAVSPCYRKEVGSYGKDTKGIYRVHEFWKVEQVVLCENDLDISMKLFEEMLVISEEVLQDLRLPYRVVQICTGDMGAGKYSMYDIETWMPSRDAYGETHSCSHMTDWQSRRLNIRYKNKEGAMTFPHAMNNTVIASPRILIALLENYQQADGSVRIPDVLQPFLGGQTSIRT